MIVKIQINLIKKYLKIKAYQMKNKNSPNKNTQIWKNTLTKTKNLIKLFLKIKAKLVVI